MTTALSNGVECELDKSKTNLVHKLKKITGRNDESLALRAKLDSNAMAENDECTSPSDKKKPLHLQIIGETICSSSESGVVRPYSSGSDPVGNDNSPSSANGDHGLKKVLPVQSVPVSTDRKDIMPLEASNDESIITVPVNRNLGLPGEKLSNFSTCNFVPVSDDLKEGNDDACTSVSSIHLQDLSDHEDMKTKTRLKSHLCEMNDSSPPNSNHSKYSNHESELFQSNSDKDSSTKSITPELAAMIPCEETKTVQKQHVIPHRKISSLSANVAVPQTTITARVVSASTSATSSRNPSELSSASFNEPVTETPKNSFTVNVVDVASTLDQVLAEFKEDIHGAKKKNKPCILQQSLIGDSCSSGTSTPCDDRSVDKANSFRVESSMLLPEESLNAIAQMSIVSGEKKEKKSIVTFAEDSKAPIKNGCDKEDPKSEEQPVITNESRVKSSTLALLNGINTEKIKEMIPSPPSRDVMCTPHHEINRKEKRAPLISGTAAAQLNIMTHKSTHLPSSNASLNPVTLSNAKPLSKPPTLISKQSIKDKKSSNEASSSRNASLEDSKIVYNNEHKNNGTNWDEGMSMLADIIAHAPPMCSQQSDSKLRSLQNNMKTVSDTMVPVGQSLKMFSSIASQAGVSSYVPYTPEVPAVTTTTYPTAPLPEAQTIINDVPECTTSNSVHVPVAQPQHFVREIGKIRRYNSLKGGFGEWEDLPFQNYGETQPRRWCELNIDESIEVPLRRGGRLRVFPNFLGESRRALVSNSMENSSLYRQYSVLSNDDTSMEPRLQVLLSSKAMDEVNDRNDTMGVGYVYRGVSMKAKPLSHDPPIEKLTRDLAELYRLPDKEWNIGTQLVYYRDGNDHTTWHADDTQGEALVLCIVVESQAYARPILVKPKTLDGGFKDGDEEIIIFVGQGDAYEMDGQMQMHYEHCLPMKQDDLTAKRTAIIFRHGNPVSVSLDTGTPLINTISKKIVEEVVKVPAAPQKVSNVHFGHFLGIIKEGKQLYTKKTLVDTGAHRQEKKLVSGNYRDGCESILVESQDRLLREDDGLCWFQITCTKANGGGALLQSYRKKSPIRVFRSSELECKYAPVLFEGQEGQVLYRYDGLYIVKVMWDDEGNETESSPSGDVMHTFFLMRQPKRTADCPVEDAYRYNRMSLQELWNEIQKRKGIRKPKTFAVPEPIMEPGRIGDKSNARRRHASSRRVLNNEATTVDSKPKIRSKPVPISYGYHSSIHSRSIYSSDSDSDDDDSDVENEEVVPEVSGTDVNDCYIGTSRPKRKAADNARNYLKEVMHVKHQREETPPKRKRQIWLAKRDGLSEENDDETKSKGQDHLSSDDSVADQKPDVKSELTTEKEVVQPEVSVEPLTIEEANAIVGKNQDDPKSPSKVISAKEDTTSTSKKSNSKNNRKRQKISNDTKPQSSSTKGNSKETKKDKKSAEVVDTSEIDPDGIVEGSRVHVEYRNTLFKATVRKTRVKGGYHEYSIHYDGNKKSNVHWIPLSMIHDVLDEIVVTEAPVSKPKRGRKRKLDAITTSPKSEPTPKSIKQSLKEKPEVKKPELKYSIGSEVYAVFKKVLYLSTVRNGRVNKKGNVEYLIHYDGFKKTSDRWIKEISLHEITPTTTRRFNEQRGVNGANDSKETFPNSDVKEEFTIVSTRRSQSKAEDKEPSVYLDPEDIIDMEDFDSGVEFLPGSCVFVAKVNALYLAKMVKRRRKGKETEYLVSFDGMSEKHNEWISLSRIYELNPKTRKIYDNTADKRVIPEEELDEDDESEADLEPSPRPTVEKKERKKVATRGRRGGGRPKKSVTSRLYDMKDIDSGVDFLPGSTLFIQWNSGLYLGKMIKRRGKGDHMEYLISKDGVKSSQDEWVPVSMCYEINPQTKRAFNKQKKKS